MKQLLDALPKTLDPTSRLALRGHIARPGQPHLRHSLRAAMWFLLPSNGVFRRSSTSLQNYLTRQGRRVVLRGGDVARPPMERRLNWILDLAPIPPRNHGKENRPPPAEPCKLPRKMRCAMSASVRHPQPPQLPQHPQPPRSAANHNSEWPDLLDQAELGWLYKPACPSLSKDTTTRSC